MNLLDLALSIQEKVTATAGADNSGSPAGNNPSHASYLRELSELIEKTGTEAARDPSPAPGLAAPGLPAPAPRLAAPFPLCRHVMPSGLRCRSPRLRGSHIYCYYHNRASDRRGERRQSRRPCQGLLELPLLEDRTAVQMAAEEIFRALAADEISERKAAVLLAALRIIIQAKPAPKLPAEQLTETNVAEDEELGEYVPLTEEETFDLEDLREDLRRDLMHDSREDTLQDNSSGGEVSIHAVAADGPHTGCDSGRSSRSHCLGKKQGVLRPASRVANGSFAAGPQNDGMCGGRERVSRRCGAKGLLRCRNSGDHAVNSGAGGEPASLYSRRRSNC